MKKGNNSKMGQGIYFKIAGLVDLDMVQFFNLNLTSFSYSFWNKGRKVLKFWKFDEKRTITPKWVMGFTSKLHGM
jgi:hypothetical protein